MIELIDKLKKDLSYNESFDITFKEVLNSTINCKYHIIFLNFLCNNESIIKIIYGLETINTSNIYELSKKIYNESIQVISNYDEIYENILAGNVVIVGESQEVIVCEVRRYPTRSISEPDNEKVVRGSREGFTENIAINIGLIRRRIKSGKLKIIKYIIGKVSKTYVSLIYLEDYVDKKYLNNVKKSLDLIEVDEITMTDKAIEELMLKNKFNPYPLVKYTERPDTFCAHLYQGMFGIIVDNSPSAMLGPICIFDHMQHAEEFRQTIISGSYLRLIRLIGIIISYLSVPLWYTLIQYNLSFFKYFGNLFIVEFNKNTIFIQLLFMELGIEFIRMASIHTPNALSTSMGLIAGIVIGEIAINIGILSPQVVLLGAISAIGSYITPSYELSLANKISKLFIIISILIFDFYGLIFSILLIFVFLSCMKSFGRPYLYPLIPFNYKDLFKQLFRIPYKKHKS